MKSEWVHGHISIWELLTPQCTKQLFLKIFFCSPCSHALLYVLLRCHFWERAYIFSWTFWWVLAKGFTNGMGCIFSAPNWVGGVLILWQGRTYNIITHMRIWVGAWLLVLCLWFKSPRNAVWKLPSLVWLPIKLCSGWRPVCALWSSGTWNRVVQAVLSPRLCRGCVSDLSWVCGREELR